MTTPAHHHAPQEAQPACPYLPVHLGASVAGHALAAAAADGCVAALRTAAALLAVSHDVSWYRNVAYCTG